MTDQEIRVGILSICKIKGSDSDINITGFHALCDKLKELGAVAEREACAKLADEIARDFAKVNFSKSQIRAHAARRVAIAIRARGQA